MAAASGLQLLKSKTQRASISLPQGLLEDLFAIAAEDGRSRSNLIAFMVETQPEEYKRGEQ